MAAKYTFGFSTKNFEAELVFSGKLYIDLDRMADGSLIDPAGVLSLLIAPLNTASKSTKKGDFAVMIHGTPAADLTFDLGKNRSLVIQSSVFGSAEAYALIISEDTDKPLQVSAVFKVPWNVAIAAMRPQALTYTDTHYSHPKCAGNFQLARRSIEGYPPGGLW